MGDAKIAPRPHTPENDDQGGNLVENVTSATAGGAKPAVIAARGSYLAKSASYFDEPDAGQSSAPAFYRHVLDRVKPSGVLLALFLVFAMQQALTMIAIGLGQTGNGCSYSLAIVIVTYGGRSRGAGSSV